MRGALSAIDAQVGKAPGYRELSYAATGDRTLVGSGGTSTVMLLYPPAKGDPAPVLGAMSAAARAAVPGVTVHETGIDALTQGRPRAETPAC
jgi:RND superfamily putative drug exporter